MLGLEKNKILKSIIFNPKSRNQKRKLKKKTKTSTIKGIINLRAEINKIGNRKKNRIINKTKSQFFEKINKIIKAQARLTKKTKRE